MKNKQTTISLEASKLISELGVEIESEKYWVKHRRWEKKNKKMVEVKPFWILELWGKITRSEYYPALSLQELFSALPAIGEKKGIIENAGVCTNCGASKMKYCICADAGICSYEDYHAPKLLDTFLSQGMTGVSAEIIRIIKEK